MGDHVVVINSHLEFRTLMKMNKIEVDGDECVGLVTFC